MYDLPEEYGSLVFNDSVMKEKLPKDIYKELQKTIKAGDELDINVANAVAHAMREWAVEKGATHFTHWFQPMTGITAEKHDSFISPEPGGKVIMKFSGKELVKGEPDASSFPSGGLRATFEARGYTAWDPTSYAFIKGNTLCIPTAFCSYSGEALDKKTPLLRSMEALDKQAKRILKLFGQETNRVTTTLGCEQEYFLIDKEMLEERPDLLFTGRTLFGAMPPKGQEMDDHYFGRIKQRVQDYMNDLNKELWALGIPAKTEHNEVAPGQHELAPVFESSNIAVDHNQLTMEMMKRVAKRHNLVCLLHEKPFEGINGSGKHNNWSLSTSEGENLLEPGDTPSHNARFLLFVTAVIKAVDEYQGLMRMSVASAGNDHRLGANEAPPAIVSIFLGDELTSVLNDIAEGKEHEDRGKTYMKIGASVLPPLSKDTTDRNRTSPFAFTGNKFEFRMVGSELSVSGPNIVLNTAVASVLDEFADYLEGPAAESEEAFNEAMAELIRKTMKEHSRIIFNGNGYDDSWIAEAEKRGLLNLKSLVDAMPQYISDKAVALFTKYGVYSESELKARYEIKLENYYKTINIEAMTMIEMAKRGITSFILDFEDELTDILTKKQTLGMDVTKTSEYALLTKVSDGASDMEVELAKLESDVAEAQAMPADTSEEVYEVAKDYREKVFEDMEDLRKTVDSLETIIPREYWKYPSYGEIIYSVH
ncbi:MAG: glutamine synthetase III [Eubacteriales bacterium]|nr:glutamine synthetase III [Eubacteriales bacterium]